MVPAVGVSLIRNINFENYDLKLKSRQVFLLIPIILSLLTGVFAARADYIHAKTGHDKTMRQRQIDATDSHIDRLVYELYGLTDEEIAIVEEATG